MTAIEPRPRRRARTPDQFHEQQAATAAQPGTDLGAAVTVRNGTVAELPRCSQCGAPLYTRHPTLGALCWWHSVLADRLAGRAPK